jgi:hypothetical protein
MTSEARRVRLDLVDGSPPELPSAPEAGLVLAYVPDIEAEACGRHLLEFAYRCRDEGHRVVLADACVVSPVLHDAAGVENGEGLTDVILHGTSLARATVVVDDGVALVTAGTIVPDPVRVLAHPRWTTLVSGVREITGLLVVAVPADADAGRLEGLASVVVRFHSDDDDDLGAAPAGPPDPADVPADVPADHAPAHDDESGPARPDPTRSGTPESGGRSGVLLLLLLLVVLGALGAAFMGWIEIPGVTPSDADVSVGYLPLP